MSRKGSALKKGIPPPGFRMPKEWREGMVAFMEASTDGFILFDEKLNVIAMNPAVANLAFVSQAADGDGIGKNILDHVPDLNEGGRYQRYLNVIRTGEPFKADDVVLHPEAGAMHLNIRAFKVGSGLGLVISDVTEQRLAEEMQKQSEERYRTLWESLNDVITVIDIESKTVVYCNKRSARLFGFSSVEEAIGANLMDFILPEDHEFVLTRFREDLWKEKRQRYEIRHRTKDGRIIWGSSLANRIEFNGRLAAIFSTRDITERRQVEEAWKESENRYKDLVDLLPLTVFEVDDKGHVIFMNRMGLESSGYSRKEIDEGFDVLQLLVPEDRQRGGDNLRNMLSGDASTGTEYTALRKDGTTFPVIVYSSAIFREGRPVGLRGIAVDITERKRAEEVVQKSEQRFRDVLNNSRDAIYRLDLRTGTYDYYSPASIEVLGYTPEEFTSLSLQQALELVHPDEVPALLENALKLVISPEEEVKARHVEFRFKHGKLGYRWMSDNRSVVYDENNKPVAVVGSMRDVTERKQAEEALTESENRFRLASQLATDVVYERDLLTGEATFYGDIDAHLGYDPGGFPCSAQGWLDHVHPDDCVHTIEKALYQSDSRAPSSVEYRMRRNDGSYMTWLDRFIVVLDETTGNPAKVIGAATDITERKQAEEALSRSEQHFRALIENATDMIAIITGDGTISYESPSVARLVGYEVEERIGRSLLELVHPEDVSGVASAFTELLDQPGSIVSMELRLKRKDGSWIFIEGTACNLLHNPAVEGIVVNVHDITERKRAEEALHERLRFESLLSQISSRFVNLPAAEVDWEIGEVLSLLIEYLDIDRSTVFELTEDETKYQVTHSRAVDEVEPLLNYVTSELLPYYRDRIARGEICMFSRLDDLPEEASADKELFSIVGLKSNLTIPLRVGESILGAIAFGSIHSERTWPDELVQRLQLIAQVIANAMTRKRTEEQLSRHHYRLEELVQERTYDLRNTNKRLKQEVEERKRVEESLRESEERYRQLFELSPDAVLVHRDGKVAMANPAAAILIGAATPEQLAGVPVMDFIPQSLKASTGERIASMIPDSGVSRLEEERIIRLDGTEIVVEAAASPISYRGDPAIQVVVRDVTERKRMEQESRTKDWAMASSINAIAMSDLDGNINYVNDAFLEMWRYDHSEEVIGRPAEAFWQDRKLAAQVIEKLFKEGFWRGEMVARREDSSIFDVEVVASMVDDDARNPICLMASFIDVTERKKAEGKLQNMYEEEKKLRRQLEHEMNKRVEFTRALAHELKTPLTPVVMSSQILCQELKDETFLRVAQNINRGAQNLNNRIDELLDLARGEVGMLQLRLEEVDVLEILKEVIEEVAPVSASRGQHLISKLPLAMPHVLPVTMADRGRVKQVVLNLLNNAFKYTPEGGKISLSVRQEDYNLIVEVKDTGPGMEKKEQEKIFNPYHRIETDREKLGGLGLGLALCKALVELHGGRIWVRSRVNKGSTFSFSLPIVKSSE